MEEQPDATQTDLIRQIISSLRITAVGETPKDEEEE